MAGRGYLKPDMRKIRNDIPKALKSHTLECIKFNREERPLFTQVRDFIIKGMDLPVHIQ